MFLLIYDTSSTLIKFYIVLFLSIVFLVALAQFYVFYEGWPFIDSFLFVISTSIGLGYGYHSPSDVVSKWMTIFVIILGTSLVVSTLLTLSHGYLIWLENHVTSNKVQSSILFVLFLLIVTNLLGTLVIYFNEKRTFIESIYFASQTCTTVGFGDLKIYKRSTKIFLLFYTILSVVVVAYCFQFILETRRKIMVQRKQEQVLFNRADLLQIVDKLEDEITTGHEVDFQSQQHEQQQQEQQQQRQQKQQQDHQHNRKVSKYQFTMGVLLHLGFIDAQKDIEPCLEKFAEFDKNDTGVISSDVFQNLKDEIDANVE